MIDMLKRLEIQVLRRAGHTLAEVATLSGVSIGTVRRIEGEDAVTAVDNDADRRSGCPLQAAPFGQCPPRVARPRAASRA